MKQMISRDTMLSQMRQKNPEALSVTFFSSLLNLSINTGLNLRENLAFFGLEDQGGQHSLLETKLLFSVR